MSLLSSIILPKLEKELIALEPVIASFVLKEIQSAAEIIIEWVETKAQKAVNKEHSEE